MSTVFQINIEKYYVFFEFLSSLTAIRISKTVIMPSTLTFSDTEKYAINGLRFPCKQDAVVGEISFAALEH